jgi:hypothetical protein
MKVHKQVVMIEVYQGYLEIISFYDTSTKTFGVDIFHEERLAETINAMSSEPMREHMLSLGYNFIIRNDKGDLEY